MGSRYASEMPVDRHSVRVRSNSRPRPVKRRFNGVMVLIVLMAASVWVYLSVIDTSVSAPIEQALADVHIYEMDIATPAQATLPVSRIDESIFINSTNAILVSLGSGEVLLNRNANQRIYPASMVKMMTALVAIENIDDLNERIFLRPEIFQYVDGLGATRAGFLPRDNVRAIDLLFGLMLPSGAECAIGLAEFVADSESDFVALMNDKAREIGMNSTNFANTTGLHSSNQFSTVEDIALLLEYALGNEIFSQLITASRHSTASTEMQVGGITFHSTLFSRMISREVDGVTILGGRTGFTNEAGQCLASFAEINGERFVLVTSGAKANGNHMTQALHIDDAFTIYAAIDR